MAPHIDNICDDVYRECPRMTSLETPFYATVLRISFLSWKAFLPGKRGRHASRLAAPPRTAGPVSGN